MKILIFLNEEVFVQSFNVHNKYQQKNYLLTLIIYYNNEI